MCDGEGDGARGGHSAGYYTFKFIFLSTPPLYMAGVRSKMHWGPIQTRPRSFNAQKQSLKTRYRTPPHTPHQIMIPR